MKRTTGISLMLLIFLSLCLIIFSLLSLSGAAADARLAQKSADRTVEYYEAVTEANEILNEIDTQLAAALQKAQTAGDYEESDTSIAADACTDTSLAAYKDACSTIAVPDTALSWETSDQNGLSAEDSNTLIGTFQYDVAVTEDQILHIELSVVWPESDTDTLYRITSWQVISTAEWSADTSQNLYRINSAD